MARLHVPHLLRPRLGRVQRSLARDFGAAGVSTAPAASLISVSWEELSSPFKSQRTVAAPYIYLVDHVVVALAIHCTASLLWHSHRVLTLYRIYLCRLCVQETQGSRRGGER